MNAQVSREKINAKRKTDREELKDWYVRGLFVAGSILKVADVPISVVECKRAILMLKRAIKEKKKTIYS